MTTEVIPLLVVPSQQFTVPLGNQTTQLFIYTKSTGLFMDVGVDDALIIGGVLCRDRTLIVRDAYLGFVGDFFWADTQGTDDPVYNGFGTRWLLAYVS